MILRKRFIIETDFDQIRKIPNRTFSAPLLYHLYGQLASGAHCVFISTKEAEYQDNLV
ncbi:hypothetical protein BTN49_2110 [Candidatus Enterovibrio escicola]|uniref:Uncharacterized protein n=1 Tax=Candidatus Enterovibrio escicola TaxID=1927127 RepID=A0A2A5T2L6_9GAMM|nr:hypothetical protein BTN49_2110 [Candidatus Enterovibrio escacola]